ELSGLEVNVIYHFRLVARNRCEAAKECTTYGEDRELRTLSAPIVSTEPAIESTATSSTLKAKVNPDGFATAYHFEWATRAEFEAGKYGHRIPAEDVAVGSGSGAVEVAQLLAGLASDSTYHYRVVASNSQGTSTGPAHGFRTPPLFQP